MAYPSTPRDAQNIPIGCVYVPGVGFVALQGGSSVNTDGNGNQSAPVAVSGTITSVTNGTNGSSSPSSSTQIGASDGTNLQPLQVESQANKNLRTSVYNGSNEMAVDGSGNASVKLGAALPAGTNVIGGVELVDSGGTNKAAISAGGAVKVDGSGVTQPVNGTVTVTQATASNLNAQIVGSVASAGSNAGNPVKVGGAFNTTQPTVSNGQIVDAQMTARGAQIVATGTDAFNVTVSAIASALSQSNQVPVSSSAAQGKLTLSGSLTANSDNSITFSGGASVARRIRIQNESTTAIYWETDATASAGSPSLAAPAANSVSVEWIAIQCTTLHIFIPSGGTTTLNGSGGVKVTAYA